MPRPIATALALLFTLTATITTFAGDSTSPTLTPPPPDPWHFTLSAPGWIPWVTGDVGFRNSTSDVHIAPDQIIPKIDMVANLRAEAHHARLSVIGEFLYLSLSDGIGKSGFLKKVDLQVAQTMGELGAAWRLTESKRGYLDLTGGVRYNNYYQRLAFQPDHAQIAASAEALATAARQALRSKLSTALSALAATNPTLPVAPLSADQVALLTSTISKIKGSIAAKSAQISQQLNTTLDQAISRNDDWWDPYVGLRGRYYFYPAFYTNAKADIGGFSVGSKLSWTAELALGYQFSPNIFAELGYRAAGVDYQQDQLLIDTITHGAQLTLGVQF
ncbi:MAG: hypothetical protein WCI46_11615 [Verrucomicrobiota bacterium]